MHVASRRRFQVCFDSLIPRINISTFIIPPNSLHHAELNVRSKRKKDKQLKKTTKEQNKAFALKGIKVSKIMKYLNCGLKVT